MTHPKTAVSPSSCQCLSPAKQMVHDNKLANEAYILFYYLSAHYPLHRAVMKAMERWKRRKRHFDKTHRVYWNLLPALIEARRLAFPEGALVVRIEGIEKHYDEL